MENKFVNVGNGVLYIHNPEEHGVVTIPMNEVDTLLNEIVQAMYIKNSTKLK